MVYVLFATGCCALTLRRSGIPTLKSAKNRPNAARPPASAYTQVPPDSDRREIELVTVQLEFSDAHLTVVLPW